MNRERYDEIQREIELLYQKDPIRVTDELSALTKKIKNDELKTETSSKSILEGVNIDYLIICILGFAILMMGVINLSSLPIYLFGLAFFAAGLGVGLSQGPFGIIFLFSHGMTGLAIMIGSQMSSIMSSPLMTDKSMSVSIYLGIIIVTIMLATIISIIYSLSKNLKKINHIILLPISLYTLVIILATLSSTLIPLLHNYIG